MIVSDIQTRVKRQFGDESGAQIQDADIIRWINDAQRDIASTNDILETKSTITIVAGTNSYQLPTAVQSLYSVWFNGIALEPKTMRQAEELILSIGDISQQSSGQPSIYWIWAGLVTLWPVPNANLTNGLTIFYNRFPVDVTLNSDTPELDVKYHNLIVDFCLQKAYELDEDWQASAAKSQDVQSGMSGILNDEKWTSRNAYPIISVLQEDL